jgi:hypothetical protein
VQRQRAETMPFRWWKYSSRLAQMLYGERSRYHINNDTSPAYHIYTFSLRMQYTRVSIFCHDMMLVYLHCVLHNSSLCYGFGKSRFVTIPIVVCSIPLFGLSSHRYLTPPNGRRAKPSAFFLQSTIQCREQKTLSRYRYLYLLFSTHAIYRLADSRRVY